MKVLTRGTEHMVETFEQFQKNSWSDSPVWLSELRQHAFARFEETGFPHRKHEEWKYTDISALQQTAFVPGGPPRDLQSVRHRFSELLTGTLPSPRIVMVNGYFSPELSDLSPLEDIAIINLFLTLSGKDQDILRAHMTPVEDMEPHLFIALNTAFLNDGLFINIPPHSHLETPIHVFHLSGEESTPVIASQRVVILAGDESRATVVEHHYSCGEELTFVNHVTEVVMNRGSRLTHIKINRENPSAIHVGNTRIRQFQDSELTSFSMGLTGGVIRNDLNCQLLESQTRTQLLGLYMPEGKQHIDNHTRIDHTVPGCTSYQLYKGILGDGGRAVFNGKIFVRKHAIHTDAHQSNRNILLSDTAHVDTKPQLEIFADDVRCAHGTTIGFLDPEALFYLQTRGVPLKEARRLITQGFANEIIRKIEHRDIRTMVNEITETKLGKHC